MLEKSYQDISKQETTNTKKKEFTPLLTKDTTIVLATVLISGGLLLVGLMSSPHLKVYAQVADNCRSQEASTDGSDIGTSDSAQSCYCFGPTDEIIPCGSRSETSPSQISPPVSVDPIPPQLYDR
jgi:hypothetical protein